MDLLLLQFTCVERFEKYNFHQTGIEAGFEVGCRRIIGISIAGKKTMPNICINDLEHYYEQSGGGIPLVFVYGAFAERACGSPSGSISRRSIEFCAMTCGETVEPALPD